MQASLVQQPLAAAPTKARAASRRASCLVVVARSIEVNTGKKGAAAQFRQKASGGSATKLLTRVEELRLLSRAEEAGLLSLGAHAEHTV